MTMTLGVEEEYLLVDPAGVPTPVASGVLATAGGRPRHGDAELQHELLEVQVEVATPVCTDLTEVAGHLGGLRATLARAAATQGCLLAAVGAAPVEPDAAGTAVTDKPRYQDMRRQAPALVEEQLINGMHVHVGVPDREAGVTVVAGVRGWLPVVLALAANSPLWRGRDSGFASFRAVHFARWPVEGPPPVFTSAQDYELRAEALLATGAIRDRGQLYWHARLSEHLPTVEIRVADVQPDVPSAVLVAGLVRALALTALRTSVVAGRDGQPPVEVLRAATWGAARFGLGERLVHPHRGRARPAGEVVAALLDLVRPALTELGDREVVEDGVARVLAGGNGAARQRAALRAGGLSALLSVVAAS